MSEIPKKIWVSEYAIEKHALAHELNGDTQYIRADIVEEMQEALEKISGFTISQFAKTSDMANECREVARSALERLE